MEPLVTGSLLCPSSRAGSGRTARGDAACLRRPHVAGLQPAPMLSSMGPWVAWCPAHEQATAQHRLRTGLLALGTDKEAADASLDVKKEASLACFIALL